MAPVLGETDASAESRLPVRERTALHQATLAHDVALAELYAHQASLGERASLPCNAVQRKIGPARPGVDWTMLAR